MCGSHNTVQTSFGGGPNKRFTPTSRQDVMCHNKTGYIRTLNYPDYNRRATEDQKNAGVGGSTNEAREMVLVMERRASVSGEEAPRG
jgi:hypothetical protein